MADNLVQQFTYMASMDLLETSQRSRERVLARIRASLNHPESSAATEFLRARSYVKQHPVGPQPELDPDTLLARFMAQSARLSATVDLARGLQDIPGVVSRFLDHHALPARLVAWPEFSGLDWAGAGIEAAFRAPVRDEPEPDLVGLTGCFAAVAETGTLALLSGPDSPASMALLPETHVAVVRASQVVAYMEDVFERLRSQRSEMPRALNFISGPSRTADIEQTLVLGAHGPYRVHLIMIESPQ